MAEDNIDIVYLLSLLLDKSVHDVGSWEIVFQLDPFFFNGNMLLRVFFSHSSQEVN